MKKGIYIICGQSGSGKGTVSGYLHGKFGAHIYRFSHPLHRILADMNMPNTRDHLAKLSLSLRENFGENIIGVGARNFIEKHPNSFIILEGVRRVHAIEGWRDLIDGILWIDASPDNRYNRIVLRGEKSGEHLLAREEFDREDMLESERDLSGLREIADITIENNGTIESLYREVEKFVIKIGNT